MKNYIVEFKCPKCGTGKEIEEQTVDICQSMKIYLFELGEDRVVRPVQNHTNLDYFMSQMQGYFCTECGFRIGKTAGEAFECLKEQGMLRDLETLEIFDEKKDA